MMCRRKEKKNKMEETYACLQWRLVSQLDACEATISCEKLFSFFSS